MRFLITLVLSLFVYSTISATAYDRIQILVEDRVITMNEIDGRLFELMRQNKQTSVPAQQAEAMRTQIVNLLIEEALLDIQADRLKIKMTEEQLDSEVDHYRKQNGLSQIEFEELLERRNISLTDFRNNYRQRTRRSMVINREIRSQIEIPDEKLKSQYEKGEGKVFRIRARHILLILNKEASADETEQVRQKILWIKKQIQAGKTFTEMADLYSQDPSVKNNHGDLGFFGKGDMVKEFADVAFSLEPGTLSEPVRSQFGFHLIEVMEKKKDDKKTFKSVKRKLYQQEYKKIFDELYKTYISSLKEKARITRR